MKEKEQQELIRRYPNLNFTFSSKGVIPTIRDIVNRGSVAWLGMIDLDYEEYGYNIHMVTPIAVEVLRILATARDNKEVVILVGFTPASEEEIDAFVERVSEFAEAQEASLGLVVFKMKR